MMSDTNNFENDKKQLSSFEKNVLKYRDLISWIRW